MRARPDALLAALLLGACAAPAQREPAPEPGAEPVPRSPAVVVCGDRYPTRAPVVGWDEEPWYDAHAARPRFSGEGPEGLRYQLGRTVRDAALARRLEVSGWRLADVARVVDQLVLHYDACGTSETCFRVLQDQRGLSVHFLLDVDGTVYQTLDLREQAWHARQANPRSIGIEIAQIGAYPPGEAGVLDEWYVEGPDGPGLRIPERLGGGGVRTEGFRGAPARPQRMIGAVQDRALVQFDFTPEQYDSLVQLTATLVRLFPRIAPDAPRDADGHVRTSALSAAEFESFGGILGHLHVSSDKVDPGPAFDWEAFLARVRAELERPAHSP